MFEPVDLPKPLLIFDAEEIDAMRAMLLRSDWRCAVTARMREFLESPGVTKHLESKRREDALAAAARVDAFFPEQVVTLMFLAEPEIAIGSMDVWCETCRKIHPCLFRSNYLFAHGTTLGDTTDES